MTQTITMRSRCAAQSVIEELLRENALTRPRSPLARFFGVSPLSAASVPWYTAALGEIAGAALLAELPPGWAVFHAVPMAGRGQDIGHIVVGPGGVFVISTRHHRGQYAWVGGSVLLVSGQETDYLAGAESEAEWVTTLIRGRMPLREPARGVIALVGPRHIAIRRGPRRVTVLDARTLRGWLLAVPEVLSAADAREVVALLDDPAVWGIADPLPPEQLMRQFTAVDTEVRAARVRRVDWALIGGALVAVAFCTAAPFLLGALMVLV